MNVAKILHVVKALIGIRFPKMKNVFVLSAKGAFANPSLACDVDS